MSNSSIYVVHIIIIVVVCLPFPSNIKKWIVVHEITFL